MQADRLLSDLESQYQRARECGFPAFVQSIDESTPLNATPYVVSLRQFVAGDWPAGRRALLDALLATIARLPQHGARAEIVLVGGSFPRRLALAARPRCSVVLFALRRRASGSGATAG